MVSPACPTCGYDLSGIVASWSRDDAEPPACPLTGVCSECGSELDWGRVLRAPTEPLPWFVEDGRGILGRAWRTWARCAWPGVFWRPVAEREAGSMSRMILWLVVLLAPLHICKAVLANAARLIVHVSEGFRLNLYLAWASDDWTTPLLLTYYNAGTRLTVISVEFQITRWAPPVLALLVASAVAPAMLWAVGRKHGAGGRGIARAAVYGLGWIVVLSLIALADSCGRLLVCAIGALRGVDIGGKDVEGLSVLARQWCWSWAWLPAVWCVWWWWTAITVGIRPRAAHEVAAVVLGTSAAAAILTIETVKVLGW